MGESPRAALFDVDGTLIDTNYLLASLPGSLLARRNSRASGLQVVDAGNLLRA
jgi:beta-phosphoglucomutase-like phosphatase (HAD superfamily)